jgi:signal transduction histidine kinase
MEPRRPVTLDRLDRTLVATVAILVVTFLVTLVPEVEVRVVAPGLDLVLDTATTLVALAVAGLAWARFRDRGQRAALFEASAFSVLAVAGATSALVTLWSLDAGGGSSPVAAADDALYASTLARLAAAALLVAGGARSLRGAGLRWPALVVVLPAVGLVAAIFLAPAWVPLLPPLVEATTRADALATPRALPHATPFNIALQVIGALMFGWAAARSRRRFRRDGVVADGYLAVGLVLAAFAQLHLAFHPSAYAGVLTSGDLLYLAFDVILLIGIAAETRAHMAGLHRANMRLEQLRDAEVERAAIEERARLSRELHDGLAQNLWTAKLAVGRLGALPRLEPEAEELCGQLDDAIDASLADARQAVMALRAGERSDRPFGELLGRNVDEFGDRFGIRAEFECGPGIPRLAPRVEAELLRIAQEALNNVRRHADATVVWVRAAFVAGRVVVSIRDNGRGFDPAAAGEGAFGLTSMRERASLIGGRLSIESRPRDGTLVTIETPDVTSSDAPGLAGSGMMPA